MGAIRNLDLRPESKRGAWKSVDDRHNPFDDRTAWKDACEALDLWIGIFQFIGVWLLFFGFIWAICAAGSGTLWPFVDDIRAELPAAPTAPESPAD